MDQQMAQSPQGNAHNFCEVSSRSPLGFVDLGLLAVLGLGLGFSVAMGEWIWMALILSLVGLGIVLLIDRKTLAFVWMAGQPTLFVFPNNIASDVPFFTMERAFFLLLLGLTLLRALTRSQGTRPLTRLDGAVLIFMLVLAVSFISTIPNKDSATIRSDIAFFLQNYAMPWLSILIARQLDWSESDVSRFLQMMTAVGLALVAIGGMEFFLGVEWFMPTSIEVIHLVRTTATFGNAAEYGSVLAATGLLTLAQLVSTRSPPRRFILACCFGIIIFGILISMTRAPLVGFAVSLLIIYAGDPRTRRFLTIGGVIGAICATFMLPFVMDMDALSDRATSVEPIYNRLTLGATAVTMIGAHPLLGVGFGRTAFSDHKTPYLTGFGEIGGEWASYVGVPHLEYLHMAVLCGLLGAAAYLWAIWVCIATLRSAMSDPMATPFARTVALYVLAVLANLLIGGLAADFLAYSYLAPLAYFMVGMASVMRFAKPASAEFNLRPPSQ
jgi:hypothetical protein